VLSREKRGGRLFIIHGECGHQGISRHIKAYEGIWVKGMEIGNKNTTPSNGNK
jgi:hypothetical protein